MASVRPGDVLAGKYRVERVLGSGGMGFVIAARHLQLDQLVAMKFLRNTAAIDDAEAHARFVREAKASSRMRNEHVARVFDVGALDTGELYIVMEYLDGCDLSALVKQRGALSSQEAVEYVLQACEALAEAHSLGIVHRDIKLANLFVTRGPGGAPLLKVLDFGVSKTNPFGETEHEMTRTSTMLGSPRFMSPEQMRDPRAVDARSDIWSLGVVLYRLIAGRAPFEADTLGHLLTKVMHERHESLTMFRPDLAPGFANIVDRCLEKDPSMRFANVAELAYALSFYAPDIHRARAAADRIAATLSVQAMPLLDIPRVPDPNPSNRSGLSESSTAAPWTGTHAGAPPPASKSPFVWAAVLALFVAMAGVGGIAIVEATKARARNASVAAAAPTAPPVPVPMTVEPSTTAVAGTATAPPVAAAEPAPTTTTPAPTVAAAAPPPPAEEKPSKPAVQHEERPSRRTASPPPAAAPVKRPAAKPAEGIPTTRD